MAQQFAWTFTYPNGKTYGYLTIPEGRHTKLEITANDVIHSFWVPELSQKQDAVPGEHNNLIVTPDAHRQLPGHLHRALRPRPRRHAEPRRDPRRRGVRHAGSRAAGQAAGAAPGLAVFQQAGCGGCHTFKPAGANGNVGPDLDKLKELAAKAGHGS